MTMSVMGRAPLRFTALSSARRARRNPVRERLPTDAARARAADDHADMARSPGRGGRRSPAAVAAGTIRSVVRDEVDRRAGERGRIDRDARRRASARCPGRSSRDEVVEQRRAPRHRAAARPHSPNPPAGRTPRPRRSSGSSVGEALVFGDRARGVELPEARLQHLHRHEAQRRARRAAPPAHIAAIAARAPRHSPRSATAPRSSRARRPGSAPPPRAPSSRPGNSRPAPAARRAIRSAAPAVGRHARRCRCRDPPGSACPSRPADARHPCVASHAAAMLGRRGRGCRAG